MVSLASPRATPDFPGWPGLPDSTGTHPLISKHVPIQIAIRPPGRPHYRCRRCPRCRLGRPPGVERHDRWPFDRRWPHDHRDRSVRLRPSQRTCLPVAALDRRPARTLQASLPVGPPSRCRSFVEHPLAITDDPHSPAPPLRRHQTRQTGHHSSRPVRTGLWTFAQSTSEIDTRPENHGSEIVFRDGFRDSGESPGMKGNP